MSKEDRRRWCLDLEDPLERVFTGVTMVLDKGAGVTALKELLEIAGDYIDFFKFSFGTSLLYPELILKKKIKLLLERGIEVYPGGTLFELAVIQGKLNEFLFRAKQIGFTAIEVSDGTISLPRKLRNEAINKASSLGFTVLTEVGKKDRRCSLSPGRMVEEIKNDIQTGAHKVIIEGRESGRGISIYMDDGEINMEMLEGILLSIRGREELLIWEAPLKKQQAGLIRKLGPDVNLGNIAVNEVLSLEALRRGLRGDTFRITLQEPFLSHG